ncbi:MAG: transketolase [Elusimicrobia bacterium RIFCSPLOWO2_01_FULL_54_10]|nr:MAG: transketolase [Elusimicrobia bacterium RIFCSPLOWO2_01_FULL_54_10]
MAAKATRQSFGEAVVALAETNPNIVVMDADLGKSTMTGAFMKKFPDRYFEFGIAEQNMISTAAGMALGGKIPFAASFSCFLVGRYETVRMSVSYSNTNVKLVGTHAGVGIGEDGNSQMGLEDIALLRSLHNFVILQPADDLEAKQAVAWAAEYVGPVYLRLTRQKLEDIHSPDYKFQMGKGDVLKSAKGGQAITIFATGGVVGNALKAVEELEKSGASINLVNMHTIKPLDQELVLKLAKNSRIILTIEDHNIVGGLGSAVSEVVAGAGLPVKVHRHGVVEFGESGTPEGLYEKFGFSASKIKALIQSL